MQPSVPNYKEFTFRDTELSIMNLLLISTFIAITGNKSAFSSFSFLQKI